MKLAKCLGVGTENWKKKTLPVRGEKEETFGDGRRLGTRDSSDSSA